jgi:hypothetical protein
MWAVMSIVEKAKMCVDNQGGHYENAHRRQLSRLV